MPTSPSFRLHLHLLPVGRRLDFSVRAGLFADIYRRCNQGNWQCLAYNAHSPFVDHAPLAPDALPEYRIRYRNALGQLTATSPIQQVHPVGLPAGPSWISLR
ncbi:hypothetical protein [Hymenobacter mucosus]|uniref:Uncharacterized protein n=1 Tax=Hymenobacter mucosus TaxID=1411120 RepID=A0A238XRM4_9BACT|nr:hypothetical protein [Hymenobacter mucosus]SNR61151.1 hypothetical protein SAMN06269173_104302 [Hymenobacter mucosus]